MEAVLEARDLARTYSTGGVDVLALRGVDISIGPGEFVAVAGPSGCGKSTLLNLLGGLDRPTAGQILLEGQRLDTRSEAELAVLRRRTLGFVFQFFNLIPNLTAVENVELPALLVGTGRREARARALSLLAELEVTRGADRLPMHLSGGEQQRLARALANEPLVVLADEPTGNLDTASARDVVALLRRTSERGQAVLLVTHDPRVAAAADRVVSLRDGLVVDEARLHEREPTGSLAQLVEFEGLR
jgi:putative ABC transport system ATP-binding protein